ncbi:Gfo/Idh/MocA family protein [Streptomyces bikiniensis]|uniref:Gfo/Idh/MocA family protein n=1 Tax=Streptomyces bikiniensis TaxID=1896 RepID=UPI0007C87438|nr:Gfo/Idh/MocA family oxidoreductase [Streptomyces bikiniensis]
MTPTTGDDGAAPRTGGGRPLRLGIAGLGVISRFYLAAAGRLPGWEVAAVCDLREEALAPYRGRIACHPGHRDLLAAGGLDALVVAVPNHAHAEVCADALRAGVPVCVEKPLALDPADGRRLAALSREHGVPLLTAFHRRYNDRVLDLLDRLPPPGAPVRVESVRVRYLERIEEHIGADTWYLDPARCGGGCVADNGPNAFDLVRLVLGEAPSEVVAADVVRDAAGTDRQAVVELAGPGGRARVELDWSYPGEVKDVLVRLDDGTELYADMLDGRPGFKESLWHEYEGVLRDLARLRDLPDPSRAVEGGLAALELVAAVYAVEAAAGPPGPRTPHEPHGTHEPHEPREPRAVRRSESR